MGQSVVRVSSRTKIFSQPGSDPSLSNRVTVLENNVYKITYYEIISGASGSITIPTGATINADEFGLSGNCVLSEIDGSNKPTYQSPQTAGGVIVTSSLNTGTGAWVKSGTTTSTNVALIYSLNISALNYHNLDTAYIIDTVQKDDIVSQTITSGDTYHSPSNDAVNAALALKADNLLAKINTNIAHTGTTAETILNPSTPISGFQANDFFNIKVGLFASNNANNKTFKVYVNTSHSLLGATQIGTYTWTTNSGGVFNFGRQLTFMNSLSSVRVINTSVSHANDEISMPNNADVTLTFDFSGTNYLIFSGTLANSADTMNIKWAKVKIER